MNRIRKSIQKHLNVWYAVTVCIIILAILTIIYMTSGNREYNKFNFTESLDETAFEINDTKITLKEAAYYIMVIESNVHGAAIEYNTNNPREYWNVYLNDGEGNSNFLSGQAKEDAMNACIRDGIYYIEALNAGITLSDEEKKQCAEDASEEEKLLTGKQVQVTQYEYKDMYHIIEKIALVKKYVNTLMEKGYTAEQLDFGGEYYEELKKGYDVKINEEMWENISLGKLTIN